MSRLHYSPFVGTGGRLQLETKQDPEPEGDEGDETASPAGAFLLVEFGEDGLSVDEVDEDTAALAVANVPGFSMQGTPTAAPSGKGRSKKSAPPVEPTPEAPVETPAEPTPEVPEAPPAEPTAAEPPAEAPTETPASEPVASVPESATTPAEPTEATEAAVPAEGESETTHPEGEPASLTEPASSADAATPAEPAQG